MIKLYDNKRLYDYLYERKVLLTLMELCMENDYQMII